MSHMIDQTTGSNAIAYVGETPWHGLGQALTAGADLETWRREAHLDWTVASSPVLYKNGELREWNQRKVLYRSDTGAPLSVMSAGFNVVQPADVLNLYSEIAKAGGFTLETAGALDGGRRIWALAESRTAHTNKPAPRSPRPKENDMSTQKHMPGKRRFFIDAPDSQRCIASAKLGPRETARCGRYQKIGEFCTQHARIYGQDFAMSTETPGVHRNEKIDLLIGKARAALAKVTK